LTKNVLFVQCVLTPYQMKLCICYGCVWLSTQYSKDWNANVLCNDARI